MPIYRKKTDASQKSIVDDLRKTGIQVIVTNSGKDFPDVLCGFAGQWVLLEIKELDGALSRGQMRFLADSIGPVGVVTSREAADIIIRNPTRYALNGSQQNRIINWLVKNPTQQSIRIKKFFELIGN